MVANDQLTEFVKEMADRMKKIPNMSTKFFFIRTIAMMILSFRKDPIIN